MIGRVAYRSRFVKRLDDVGSLPAITTEAADLPDDVLALLDQHLLDLGSTYGDPQAGDPVQDNELRIEHDQGDVEIVVYHRAILLFTSDDEGVRRIAVGVRPFLVSRYMVGALAGPANGR